jgi:hypothetical protein
MDASSQMAKDFAELGRSPMEYWLLRQRPRLEQPKTLKTFGDLQAGLQGPLVASL